MQKATHYTIIFGSNENIQEFINKVNQHIEKGWTPQGGLSSIPISGTNLIEFCQAMAVYKLDVIKVK